jgi:hypothetical protein
LLVIVVAAGLASTTGGTNSPKRDTAGVLGWTAGPVIVAVVGLILIGWPSTSFALYSIADARYREV